LVTTEVGEAHSTVDDEDNKTSFLGKGLYFRDAFMNEQPLDIEKYASLKFHANYEVIMNSKKIINS